MSHRKHHTRFSKSRTVQGTRKSAAVATFSATEEKPSGLEGFYLVDLLEARAGIEPAHKGFADLSLTTWVPRLTAHTLISRCRTHKLT